MRKAIILLDDGSLQKGEVINIIEMTSNSGIGLRLPEGQTIWDCGQYPVAIGDRWENGRYSRDGEELETIPTADQKINELQAEMDALLGGEDV